LAVHTYRRWLGRNRGMVEKVVQLVRTGPLSTRKDVLAALLCLSAERENVDKLLGAGAAEAALSAIGEETTAAVLASLEKRGGAEAIIKIDGAVAWHGVVEGVLHDGAGAAVPALESRDPRGDADANGLRGRVGDLGAKQNL
jgi:hypothetical protein